LLHCLARCLGCLGYELDNLNRGTRRLSDLVRREHSPVASVVDFYRAVLTRQALFWLGYILTPSKPVTRPANDSETLLVFFNDRLCGVVLFRDRSDPDLLRTKIGVDRFMIRPAADRAARLHVLTSRS
jgi:hypothetical protein